MINYFIFLLLIVLKTAEIKHKINIHFIFAQAMNFDLTITTIIGTSF